MTSQSTSISERPFPRAYLFFISENEIILTLGVGGVLSLEFLIKAINFRTGKTLLCKSEMGEAANSVRGAETQADLLLERRAARIENRDVACLSGEPSNDNGHRTCLGNVGNNGDCDNGVMANKLEKSRIPHAGVHSLAPPGPNNAVLSESSLPAVTVAEPSVEESVERKIMTVVTMSPQKKNLEKRSEDNAKEWIKDLTSGNRFLGENREYIDRMHLLNCEQKAIWLRYRRNVFNSRGIMRGIEKLWCTPFQK